MFIRNIQKKDLLHRLIYSRLKYLVAMTEIQKQELLKCLPLEPERYVLIPNGVDTKVFHPGEKSKEILESWNCKESEILIGFVGRFDPQKGVFELLEAARELNPTHPKIKFVFMGHDTLADRSTEKSLYEKRRSWNLEASVILDSFKPDVARYMRCFDIFVMPSYEESFGLVLIEAMASGIACISTAAGGPLEILEQGKIGLLSEPRSSASLQKSIQRLIEDPKLRQQLAESGRKKAVEEYDSLLVFNRLKSLIKS